MELKLEEVSEEHSEALARFEDSANTDREQRRLATEDMIFINKEDGMWSEDVVEKRQDRPRYSIDRISGALNQVVGNQRQTRTGIKVHPETEGNEATARILTGLIRSIETLSRANNCYDMAFNEQVTSGYGGWRVLTEYKGEDSFDQEIVIKPIHSAANRLYFDPTAIDYTKRDARFAFLIDNMRLVDYKKAYPDAAIVDMSLETNTQNIVKGWFTGETVRIAEYWYKVPVKRNIAMLSDGRVIDMDEEKDVLDELLAMGIQVVKEREVDSHRVERRLMNGAEFMTEPEPWAGRHIPLIPTFGINVQIDGRHYIRGIVRKAKDAQRIYNYATSAAIEATAMTPKDPYWITPDQAKGHESKLKSFNTKNSPFMLYNPDPMAPGPPARGGAPQVQSALIQQKMDAGNDIYSTTGIEPASLGNSPELKSGKAITAQQAMGDRGSFVYTDNLEKSKEYTGEILVDLIPRVYDSERVVKVLGPEETPEDVQINTPQYNELNQEIVDRQTGKQVIVNDLSLGKYSVTVSTGPSFTTKRQETVSQLTTLAGQSQIIQDLALDLIIDNMDINKGDEMKARVRRQMIKDGLIEPSEQESKDMGLDQPQKPSPVDEAMVKNLDAQTEQLLIGNEKIISEIKKNDADTQKKFLEAQQISVESLNTSVQMILKKLDAGIPVQEADVNLIEGQKVMVEETQEDVLSGGEVAGSAPLGRPGQPNQQEDIPVQFPQQ